MNVPTVVWLLLTIFNSSDDEVIFVDYNQDKSSFLYGNNKAYHISSVGFTEADGKCILNNVYD